MSTTTTRVAGDSRVCVRPAWGADAPPLSTRAAELMVREWRSLGLLDGEDDETDPQELLRGVQERSGGAITASRGGEPDLALVTEAPAAAADGRTQAVARTPRQTSAVKPSAYDHRPDPV